MVGRAANPDYGEGMAGPFELQKRARGVYVPAASVISESLSAKPNIRYSLLQSISM